MAPRTAAPTVVVGTTNDTKGAIEMLADFEYRFNLHEETVRKAEANARLQSALAANRPSSDVDIDRPHRRLSTLLRRLAGTAVTAA
jgi:hypothetical protein